MKILRADKEIIYLWVNRTDFIYNKKEFPFLQNIISHAIPKRNIHIIFFQLTNLDELDKNIKALNDKLLSAGLKNIHCYKLTELFSEETKLLEWIAYLLSHCKSLANPIDLVKVMVGANLKKLNLEQGLLADMDCIIPENLRLSVNALSVFPLIDKKTRFENDYRGILNCYVENGFSLILHSKNSLFNEVLTKISAKKIDYFCKKPNDGVYSLYVETLIQYFTNNPMACNEQLMKKYRNFSDLPGLIKDELTQLEAIAYYRGNSWCDDRKEVLKEDLRLVFIAGYQPIYPQEISQLKHAILFNQLDKAFYLLQKLIKKGWNPNEKIEWINALQKEENILYYLLERNAEVSKENLKRASQCIVLLMENGLTADDNVLSFFMQTYHSPEFKEAFEVYAKVFADNYGLDYARMLSDSNHDLIPSPSIFKCNLTWRYIQPELKTVEVSNDSKESSMDKPQKPLFFKLTHENDKNLFSVEKSTRLSKA